MQTTFILERNQYIIPQIVKILKNISYDMVIFTLQFNDIKSLRYTQVGWIDMCENDALASEFSPFLWKENTFVVKKLTRSAFKAQGIDIHALLQEKSIEEIHIVGTESNDCVMATALESMDLGYYTFVIEEAVETGHTALNQERALGILNYLNITNNSNFVGRENTASYEL